MCGDCTKEEVESCSVLRFCLGARVTATARRYETDQGPRSGAADWTRQLRRAHDLFQP